ncbi:PepSY-associated TM helix domain-containing protein [Mesonia maritima]|uniref:Iron-regulated membrane protein n=2 Tax=Mesonia maritima TaxID=1793873 RepID=A0ABU1K2V8_9FLAO|nr:PepSY-associated TM helix domain-containing protein [Mesonia maritima]MDR6299646.1 putative iron-regulated membrane protein [Mesonia maritima]
MASKSSKNKKKKNKSYFYRLSAWLHLWLGLISGIVVVIVSLTATILVFERELKLIFEPYQTVEVPESKEFLPPSILSETVKEKYGFTSVWGVFYRGEDKSVEVPYYADRSNYQVVYVNPYTGKILHNRYLNNDFWRFVLEGHYNFWLPRNIGKPLVAYATLIFVITLLTGLVLWWPKKWTKATKNASFKIKWKAKFKRLNYDLHNVLGFYTLLIALIFGLTGMVYGMSWFRDFSYWTASGGEEFTRERFFSDTTAVAKYTQKDEDVLFNNVINKVDPKHNKINVKYPYGKNGVWSIGINPSMQSRWQTATIHYEQNSLRAIKVEPTLEKANGGDQLMRLNYDLHVGAIGGITTKIIAFLVCIVATSLPITGFIIWWKKGNKWKGLKFPLP